MYCEKFLVSRNSAVALGCFDGIHIGHRAVIAAAVDFARENSLKSIVFKIERSENLIPPYETAQIIQSQGVDTLITQPLNHEFRNLTCEEFVREILRNQLQAKFVSVGENFRFGKNAAGNAALLRELCAGIGIEVNVTPLVRVDGEVVSSTKIRELIKSGNLAKAAQYLGRDL